MRGTNKPMIGVPGYRERIVKLYTADPDLTVEQVYARTGASRSVVQKVRRDLVARGVLKSTGKRAATS